MICTVQMVWSLASLQILSIMLREVDLRLATSVILSLVNDVAVIFASLNSMRTQNHV